MSVFQSNFCGESILKRVRGFFTVKDHKKHYPVHNEFLSMCYPAMCVN